MSDNSVELSERKKTQSVIKPSRSERSSGHQKQYSVTADKQKYYQILLIMLIFFATCYNFLFAFLNAHVLAINFNIVTAMEIFLLASALILSLSNGIKAGDFPPLLYLYLSIMIGIVISMNLNRIFVDGIRTALIVSCYTLVGSRCSEKSLRIAFTAVTGLALLFLVIEMASTETYAWLFRPVDYFAATRGYPLPEWAREQGLALGTVAYEGRFNLGIWNGPRTSTIFLEQTGINSFSIVLMVYIIGMWNKISRYEVTIIISTVFLIILTNNGRMAVIFSFIILFGYFIFPLLPRYTNIFVPFLLLSLIFSFFFSSNSLVEHDDTLVGRMAVTYKYFHDAFINEILLGNPDRARHFMDTGYGNILGTTTIFGLIAYCIYVAFIVPQTDAAHRRTAWAISAYLFLWLLVGGTSSGSIKTAALLWALAGFFRSPASTTPTDVSANHSLIHRRQGTGRKSTGLRRWAVSKD